MAESAENVSSSQFGWTRGDRHCLLISGGIILALLLIHWGRMTWRREPAVEIHRLDAAANQFQLDVNSATWVEWMQLDGVGEARPRSWGAVIPSPNRGVNKSAQGRGNANSTSIAGTDFRCRSALKGNAVKHFEAYIQARSASE